MPVEPATAEAMAKSLVRVMKVMGALRHHAPREHPGVDPSQYQLLFVLSGEPRRVSALAEAIHSDVSSVSRQVSHLAQQGVVEKIGDPSDGRAQLLSLTPAGRQLVERLVRARGRWFEQLLATWSDEEARTFARLLARFGDDAETFKARLGTASAPAPPPPSNPSSAPAPPPLSSPSSSPPSTQEH